MISTYLRLAWRNLLANKTVSLINIFGLSIAVACCIAVFLFLQNYWTLDSFHEHGERIFMVEYVTETDGEKQTWGDAPAPIASALADPNAIILSADMAQKYFGEEMPVGRTLTLVTDDQERKQFIVQGVAQPFPNNRGFAFNLLTGYHPVHKTLKVQDWKTGTSNSVFVQLRQSEDAAQLAPQMARYLAPFNAGNPEANIISFALDNLRNPMPGAYDVMRRPAEAPHPALTIMFSLIALTMMALSCFNYVNISLGGVSRRLKEIGIRKVMGGQREQLVTQFMTENLLLCFIALLFGLMLAEAFLIPLLNATMVLKTKFSFADNASLWLMLAGLLALTALASGAYPSLYVSSFKPVAIFTGRLKFSGKNFLRRSLLTAQFVLAFIAVIITVLLMTTLRVWEKLTWGYDPGQTLVVQLNDSRQFPLLRNEILKNPNVLRVAGAANHVGQAWRPEIFQIDEAKQKASRYDVGVDYQEALGLDLNAGRFFDSNRRVEDENAVVVNETLVRKQGWNEAIGKRVRIETKDYTIVGVAGDFKLFATGATRPALFFRAEENSFNYLVLRFAPGSGKQVAAQIEQDWQRLFPGMPVNHFFQTEVFDSFYQTSRKLAKSFGYIAGLALVIACMGLYGLATQHFSRRLKEVGVRKMLGASIAQILLLVNREFVLLLLIAGTLATALSFIGIRVLLQEAERYVGNYAPGLGPFFLANLIVLLTAAIAVGRQSWNVTKVNPAEMLKNTE